MARGDFASACPKIADSEAQAPSPTTALTLAICYEKSGKLATASAAYNTAAESATAAHNKRVASSAQQHVAALEPRLARLTIQMPQDAAGAEARCDGEIVPEADWGRPVARDAGDHDIEVTASGKKPWKKRVALNDDGQTVEVSVPALEADAEASPPPEATTPSTTANASSGTGRGNGQRIGGLAVAGAGVVVLGLGVFAGLEANATYHDALSACGGTPSCSPGNDGPSLRDKAGSWATISTVSFIAGGAALAGGAVLFFTAPHDPAGPVVGVGAAARGTGVSVFGRF